MSSSRVGLVVHCGDDRLIAECGRVCGSWVKTWSPTCTDSIGRRPDERVDRRARRKARKVNVINVSRLVVAESQVLPLARAGRLVGIALLFGPPLPPGFAMSTQAPALDCTQYGNDSLVALVDLLVVKLGDQEIFSDSVRIWRTILTRSKSCRRRSRMTRSS